MGIVLMPTESTLSANPVCPCACDDRWPTMSPACTEDAAFGIVAGCLYSQ